MSIAAIRYDVAGVTMLGYAWLVADDPLPRGYNEWTVVLVGSTLIIAAYHALLFVGESDPAVTSAVASVIVGLSPVLTTVFARVLLPAERLTPIGVVGLLVGLIGAVVLAAPDPANLTAGGTVAKFLVFLAAAAFALGSVITRALDTDLEIETMEAWAMLLGAGLMHLAAAAIGESPTVIVWTTEAVLALGYLAVVASSAGYLLYFRLLDQLGPIEINLVSYVAPVFAALSGWLVLGEGLESNTVAGFVLVCGGFAIVKRTAIRTELRRTGLLA